MKKQKLYNQILDFNIEKLLQENKKETAINMLRDVLKLNPDRNNAELLMRLLDNSINNFEEIIELIFTTLEECNLTIKNRAYLKLYFAKLLLEHYEYDEALFTFNNLINDKKNTPYSLFTFATVSKARLNRYLKNYDEIESSLLPLVNKFNNDDTVIELGNFYKSQKDFEKALYYYKQCSSIPIKNINIINLEIQLKHYENAYKYLLHDNLDFMSANYFLKNKLNIANNKNSYPYLATQLLEYNELNSLNHIALHFDKNKDKSKQLHSIFNNNFNLNEKFHQYKQDIKQMTPCDQTICNCYLIEEEDIIGSLNIFDTNLINIIADFDDNIINIYPVLSHYKHNNNKLSSQKFDKVYKKRSFR